MQVDRAPLNNMKALLGLILCTFVSTTLAEESTAYAFIRGNPVRKIFDRWLPKGLPPNTDFTYELRTTPDMKIELHCPYISLHQDGEPCSKYLFRIIDGDYTEDVCERVKKFRYKSKTNNLKIQIKTGDKYLKVQPRCSGLPYK
uniref:Venom CUB domain protein 6 n=1 Tax=Oncocephalus sp. TaxID=2944721 RepID=A0AB38ZET9_9HEMI